VITLRNAVSWLAYPVLMLGGLAAVRASLAAGVPPTVALVALQTAIIVIAAVLERLMPEHVSWNRSRHDLLADALHFIISGILVSGTLRLVIFHAVPSLGLWPARWPVAVQLIMALGLADAGSYLTHVVTHRVAWLWPIHAIHHSARRLYWLNSTRMHPLDAASTVIISLVPLAILGVPTEVLALFDAFAIVHLVLQHSNIRLRHGALSWVVATAEFHRWHHSPERAEGEHNYASFLSLWDQIFRTFRMPAGREMPETVGLYDGATLPDGWTGQTRYPFRTWRKRHSGLAFKPDPG